MWTGPWRPPFASGVPGARRSLPRPFPPAFDLSYLPQPKWTSEGAEIELRYEDMEVAYYDGINFDVDLMVLEQIELAIPMKFVCREDCKGLCYNAEPI